MKFKQYLKILEDNYFKEKDEALPIILSVTTKLYAIANNIHSRLIGDMAVENLVVIYDITNEVIVLNAETDKGNIPLIGIYYSYTTNKLTTLTYKETDKLDLDTLELDYIQIIVNTICKKYEG